MPRLDVTQDVVLDRIIKRLRADLALNERLCYETWHADAPVLPKAGTFFVTVTPGESEFISEISDISPQQCTERWALDVTIWTRIKLDATDYDEKLFRDADRGLFNLKAKVLQCLVGYDPETERRTVDTGDTFVREWIKPTHCTGVQYNGREQIGWIRITFAISWDWDLT